MIGGNNMAQYDREIELKFSLEDHEFLRIKEKLKQIAEFGKLTEQKDEYFTPAHRNFMEPRFPFEFLSIRQRGEKTILNYKYFYPENSEVTTHCDEFETLTEDPEKIRKIFLAIGMKPLVIVKKNRETYIHDDFEIALDTVEELGHFIEIEAMKHENVEQTRKKLFDFAKSLGIISETEKRGYPYMLMKKKGMIK